MTTQHLTLEELIVELRRHLLDQIQVGDSSQLFVLGYVFSIIEETAIAKNDTTVAKMAMHFYEAVRDAIEGETWKSSIPTVEQIRDTFADRQ